MRSRPVSDARRRTRRSVSLLILLRQWGASWLIAAAVAAAIGLSPAAAVTYKAEAVQIQQ